VTRAADGSILSVTGPFSAIAATNGSVVQGEPAVPLKVTLGAQLRKDKSLPRAMAKKESAFSKCLTKREPLTDGVRCGYSLLECFEEPSNYAARVSAADGPHLTWAEYVHAIKDPIVGMDAYVYNMKKNLQQEPQQTEMQRIGPDIRSVLADWASPARSRAAHYHLLAALSRRPMGNYDYAFIQREVLRTFPIEEVQHLFCVLSNGSGCAVQVLQTPCLTALDMLEVVMEKAHDKLWEKRLPKWKRIGEECKPSFGPLFKVPVRFMDKNMPADDRRPAWADPDGTPSEFWNLPAMKPDEHGTMQEDAERTDRAMMQRLAERGCSGGDDTAVYSASLEGAAESRTVLMFVSQCVAVDAAIDLVIALYDRMVSNYRMRGQVAPRRRMFTAQTQNQSRGTSIKDSQHGSFVTDLLSNQAWDTDGKSALMKGTAVLDESAQAIGRACERRCSVPVDVLKYQAEGGPLHVLIKDEGRDYSDEVFGLFRFCEDNPRFCWTNANKRNLIQRSLDASQELMLGIKEHYALGRSAEEVVGKIIAERPAGALHSALFSPIAYAKTKRGLLPMPVYMAMGAERSADASARGAIELMITEVAREQRPPSIALATVDPSAEVHESLQTMLQKAEHAQQGNVVIPAGISATDASMHALSVWRDSVDERVKERKERQLQLRRHHGEKEKSIKAASQAQRPVIRPNSTNRFWQLIQATFGGVSFSGLVAHAKEFANAQQMDEKRVTNLRDFGTWCIFAVGSMIEFHKKNPGEGPLETSHLEALLLDARTNENMTRYVKAFTTATSYAYSVSRGWKALYNVLAAMKESRQQEAGLGDAGSSSSAPPPLLMQNYDPSAPGHIAAPASPLGDPDAPICLSD